MKILSMTATFGKLEHQTLALQPGMNVLEAPNEWGKSTWCAFIVAMFYGISTSSQRKKDFLPDKERYAPWSGRPMAGRMELVWQGKEITVERSQKGKIPFGNFRAYETRIQVELPELTAENCGQLLLGVEREVFTRAGFLRGSDLPVLEGEALRRRLNALVTTGDESGASDDLAKKLRELRNKCQHNKTGLIPQAQAQQKQLQDKLDSMQVLKQQRLELQQELAEQEAQLAQLENHKVALDHARSLQTQTHLDKAKADLQQAQAHLAELEEQCRELPDSQTARRELERLQLLQQQLLQQQAQPVLPVPQKPEPPQVFAGKDPAGALQQANGDSGAYKMLCKPVVPVLLILAGLMLLSALGAAFVKWQVSLVLLALAGAFAGLYLRNKKAQLRDRQAIVRFYGNAEPESWIAQAQAYADAMSAYQAELADYEARKAASDGEQRALNQTVALLTGGKPIAQCVSHWQAAVNLQQQRLDAQKRCQQAKAHAETVGALVQTAPPPRQPDPLHLSMEQTQAALQQTRQTMQQLQARLARCETQMESLGDRAAICQELEQVEQRLARLEDMYGALALAESTLTQAATELQRRFAPRISARARELFSQLTAGRYERLLLASDFSMEVAAADEDTTHGVLWRSDGTVDQLYLALRLAVAEELTPEAPLVLDDALVRFDGKRLEAAMEILKQYSQDKQVILFTCQERENRFL